eukprot:Skav225910  [mRNA]  locus=scaffold1500:91851:93878:- [translate_table: standard]
MQLRKVYRDELFTKFSALLNDKDLTKKRLQAIADKGRERSEEISADQQRAAISSVRVFRPFPAWKCNMVLMSSKFEGSEGRCFGAVLDMAASGATGVRVVLRSLEGGHGGTAGGVPRGSFLRGIPVLTNTKDP